MLNSRRLSTWGLVVVALAVGMWKLCTLPIWGLTTENVIRGTVGIADYRGPATARYFALDQISPGGDFEILKDEDQVRIRAEVMGIARNCLSRHWCFRLVVWVRSSTAQSAIQALPRDKEEQVLALIEEYRRGFELVGIPEVDPEKLSETVRRAREFGQRRDAETPGASRWWADATGDFFGRFKLPK